MGKFSLIVVPILILIGMIYGLFYLCQPVHPSINETNYDAIKWNTTRRDVERILGPPRDSTKSCKAFYAETKRSETLFFDPSVTYVSLAARGEDWWKFQETGTLSQWITPTAAITVGFNEEGLVVTKEFRLISSITPGLVDRLRDLLGL